MDSLITQSQYIRTKTASCRDCYMCLKSCPVKAIKVKDGQAYIIDERCIHCNICAQNCAQNAIYYKNDKDKFYELLSYGKNIIISVSPSFSSICEQWEIERFPSALRKLGANYVSTTSSAAIKVASDTLRIINSNPQNSYITSICPTVVNYIEKYKPELIDLLVPIASPYIVNAKLLRKKFGNDSIIIHIDSCIANKIEILRPEYLGIVNLVLSFSELREIFDEQGISLMNCEESSFDEKAIGNGSMYQLVGGLSRTMDSIANENTKPKVLAISGYLDIYNAADFAKSQQGILVEPLFCYKGCINGPGIHIKNNVFERQKEVESYINSCSFRSINLTDFDNIDTSRTFNPISQIRQNEYSDTQINEVLMKIGMSSPTNRPNCFSCGYPTCREKAVAVLDGMAEIKMCIPYMRRFAENKSAKILESSPSGIVTINEKYEVVSMNPTFRKLFQVSDSAIGRHISKIMDPEPFEYLVANKLSRYECTTKFERFGIVCFQVVYNLDNDNSLLVGMFINITQSVANEGSLDKLRHQTLEQAKELLTLQTAMATSIAKILGENTASSESLLENLIKLTQSTTSQETPLSDNSYW